MFASVRKLIVLIALCALVPVSAMAQAQPKDDPDRDPNNAQPDFTVSTLPTTLRLPEHRSAFRLTHRFLRTLGDGDFSDLLSRFFGFDTGAQIGFEYRYGIFKGAQLGVYRTSDATIQLFGQYDIKQQKKDGSPIGFDMVVNVDGTDNFSEEFSPGIQFVFSHEFGEHGAVYFEPSFVGNTNLTADPGDDSTTTIGLGARVRALKNMYLFFEAHPRVSGYTPGVNLMSFGLEGRAGGHMFQLNFSNGYGTTLAQVARGGTATDDWYIGFNLTRKFF